MDYKQKKNRNLLFIIIGTLILACAIAIFVIIDLKTEKEELIQESLITKQQLNDEYENMNVQYEGFKLTVKNDSILEQLNNEQLKVQNLMTELKTIKETNHKEINRLTQELSSLRKVLRSYIYQIDSLNRANESLRTENKIISQKYEQTQKNLATAIQQKDNLTQKVQLASKLDATNITVRTTNNKGKEQKKIKKIDILEINLTIAKNITVEPGEKIIYFRIMKPDDEALTKSSNSLFEFENKNIEYSIKKNIEYTGEQTPITVYWNVEEFLPTGSYRLDVFCDGSRIGQVKFNLTD